MNPKNVAMKSLALPYLFDNDIDACRVKNTIENVTIYNVLGKKVKSISINKNEDTIDVSTLNSGIYILKYTVDSKVGTMKFVKE